MVLFGRIPWRPSPWAATCASIWTAFEENGIGTFPQRQVYPMEWPPSKAASLRPQGLQAEEPTPAVNAPDASDTPPDGRH